MSVPTATYRVQISPSFDLYDAAQLTKYLAALGVSHLYASPLFAATPGSMHGYDIVDHSKVDLDRGGERGRKVLIESLQRRGLGLIVDIVPNHCGVAMPKANPAWWSVLRFGQSSPYASWFDIDWSYGYVMLPLLHSLDQLDDLRVESTVDGKELVCGDLRLPIAPGTEGDSARDVLSRQHYRLVPYDCGELNYRRFSAESTLAALRVEDPAVFDATHALLIAWAHAGEIDGVRIDHLDGLADPLGYLERLVRALPDETWVIIEKILMPGESVPDRLVCSGTTGYDTLRDVCGVFRDPNGELPFTRLEAELTGPQDWSTLVRECKNAAIREKLAGELRRLVGLRPLTLDANSTANALAELLICYPVERSYLPHGIRDLEQAAHDAIVRQPNLKPVIEALLPRLIDPNDELARRFQQTSCSVSGVGISHSAMHRWSRFVALCELGGSVTQFSVSVDEFHAAAGYRSTHWQHSMTMLSTHDTHRSEDVRARLAVLSEIPNEWAELVRKLVAMAPIPDSALAHMLWQTVAGTWPIEYDRMHRYITNLMGHMGSQTSWTQPNLDFEKVVLVAVNAIYDDPSLRGEIAAFAEKITPFGWVNSLGQKVIQLAMPAVPDIYQGTELWDNSLGDPDNRRPVDFALRKTMLSKLDGLDQPPAVDASGAAKLFVVSQTLRARRDRPELFTNYAAIRANGRAADHVLSFDRGGAIAVATRLPVGLARIGGWGETTLPLPDGRWVDAFTKTVYKGTSVRLDILLSKLPVALLLRQR